MTTFRDWPRELRRASFRGVSFFVERDGVETGRRLVVHEFPHRDTPYVEDMGRDTYKISLTAYVVGNGSDSEALALRRACETRGQAQLQLPLERFLVHCEKVSREFSKDRLGYIAFNISFVRHGDNAGMIPIPVLSHMVGLAVGAILGPLRVAFAGAFNTLGGPGYLIAQAAAQIRLSAAAADAAAGNSAVEIERVPELKRLAADLFDDADDLARFGAQAHRLTATSFVAETDVVSDPIVVDRVVDLFSRIGISTPARAAVEIMEDLAQFGLADSADGGSTPGERQEAANLAAFGAVVRIASLAAMATAAADVPLSDRREAVALRAKVAELFSAERERALAAIDHDLSVVIEDLTGRVVEQISRRIADLAPIVTVSAAKTMPSIWWSYRIYGTAERAGELVRRNRVKHPSFMPIEFEALAR